MKRICVIGAGISGLCVAHRLARSGADVRLFEKQATAGGNIRTENLDGFMLEHGPNSLLMTRTLWDLIEELGLSGEIAVPNIAAKKRFIIRDGRLTQLPSSLLQFAGTGAFSGGAKLRLLREPFVSSRSDESETIDQFFERRLGREIVDYAVDPFISGIYAGDPSKLSMRHAFPRIFELEARHGSLIKGFAFSKKNEAEKLPKNSPRSISLRRGMQTLTDALALGIDFRPSTNVRSITNHGGRYVVETEKERSEFEAVVICTPAKAAAALVDDLDRKLPAELASIEYSPIAVVFSGYPNDLLPSPPEGFGFLVPKIEKRRILGSLWTSSVFDGRAPEGFSLFTTFVGGARDPKLVSMADNDLIDLAAAELEELFEIRGKPVFTRAVKWPEAIPQYNVGYGRVIEAVDDFRSREPGIFFCSNFYKGISVADCVKNAEATAKDVLRFVGHIDDE